MYKSDTTLHLHFVFVCLSRGHHEFLWSHSCLSANILGISYFEANGPTLGSTRVYSLKQKYRRRISILPYVISFTISLAVPDEASAGLIQVLAAFSTLQAGCVPLQVRGDSQYVLVMYLTSTAYTHRESGLLCRKAAVVSI